MQIYLVLLRYACKQSMCEECKLIYALNPLRSFVISRYTIPKKKKKRYTVLKPLTKEKYPIYILCKSYFIYLFCLKQSILDWPVDSG